MSCLYILDINTLLIISSANSIFSHSEGCLFVFFMVSFAMQKLLSFIGSHLLYFCFYFHYSRRWVKKDLAVIYVKECCSYLTQLYSGENFLWVITIKLNSQVNLNAWYTILNTVQFICYLSLTLLLQIRKLRPKILNDSVPNISQIICVQV